MTKLCGKMTVIRQAALIVMLALFCVLSSSLSYAQDCGTPPTNGLVGYWALDETGVTTTAVDSSGNGISGTMQNGLSGNDSASGVVGTSLTFGGVPSDHSIDFTNAALNTEEFTFSTWVKTDVAECTVADFNCPGIVRKIAGNPPSSTVNAGWYIVTKYGQARASIYDGSTGGYDITHDTRISDNKWHHVVLVRDAAKNMSIYVDGVLGETGSDAYTIANTEALQLGDNLSNAGGGANHQGQIDETRYYNRALSAEEITQIYQYGLGDEGTMIFDERHASMKYCNGTDWVHAGLGPYVPNAVELEATDYLTHAFTADTTKQVTGSMWLRLNDLSGQVFLDGTDSSGTRLQWTPGGGARFNILHNDVDNALALDVDNASTSTFSDQEWHHVLFSFDMSDPTKAHMYVDGVSDMTVATFNDANLKTDGTYYFGRSQSGASTTRAMMADFWLDYGTYIDLSVEANRRKFISESGMPMYLGQDGSLPTGSAPDIFFTGDTENWHTNKGAGGGFTENGELTYSSSRPGQSASLSGSGYFVEMPYFVDADLGGISGASQTCLTELNNNDWLGKDNAVANGQLASTNVRAWLCDANGCNDFVPDTEYFYASMWQPTAGGASMTSTAEGYLEDDGVSFESSGVFGFNAQMHEYWTGRTTTNGIQPDNCNNWTSSASGPVSYVGTADVTFYPEKLYKYSKGCEIADEVTFICIVDPPGCHAQGAMKYNADFNVMEYCNGTEWVSMGPVGGTPPTDGLVGHWTLDETSGTFADSSGNSNTGTESGGVGYDQFGILGRAVSFDGADDLIDVGSNAVLDDLGPLSICAWVKPDSYGGGGFGRIFSKANNLNTSFYVENDSSAPDETLAFYVNGASNLRVKGQDGWLASGFIGEWNHVCVSWDGVLDDATGVKLYRNATEAPSYGEQLNGALPRTSDAAENGYIGNNGVNSRDFDGMIDEVRVYNRVLSATEIQQLYYYGLSNGLGDVDNGCTSPAANEGEMIYNADFNVMQYCNGEQWIGLGQ